VGHYAHQLHGLAYLRLDVLRFDNVAGQADEEEGQNSFSHDEWFILM
jgi:hypothetical protein